MTTFVSIGNATQPFPRLIDAVLWALPHLPQPVVIQYGNTVLRDSRCIGQAFMGVEEFIECITRSKVLILHGGAGSIIHAIQAGKVPVVMPRLAKYGEIIDNHQLEFAMALAESGRIVVAQEPSEMALAVREALKRQETTHPLINKPPMIDMVRTVLRSHAESKAIPFAAKDKS